MTKSETPEIKPLTETPPPVVKPTRIHVNTELRDLIPPLTASERDGLERSLRASGRANDAITIWAGNGAVLDGHNRFEICERLGLPYDTRSVSIPDMQAAKQWMYEKQIGQRNLSPDQQIALALLNGLEIPAKLSTAALNECAGDFSEAHLQLVLSGKRSMRSAVYAVRKRKGATPERAPNRTPLKMATDRADMLTSEDLAKLHHYVAGRLGLRCAK